MEAARDDPHPGKYYGKFAAALRRAEKQIDDPDDRAAFVAFCMIKMCNDLLEMELPPQRRVEINRIRANVRSRIVWNS